MYRYPLLWWSLGFVIVSTIIYLSLTAHPPDVLKFGFDYDKVSHLLAYCILMGWFTQLVTRHTRQIIFALLFIAMGILLEWLQSRSGYRVGEQADILANCGGVLLGWWLSASPLAGMLSRLDNFLITRLKQSR